MDERLHALADSFGTIMVDGFHVLALFAIGATTVWAAAFAFVGMVRQGHASIEDILLLFIYLELGAMVGIYFKTTHMPVRFLIYIAITALTRALIESISIEHQADIRIILLTGGILLLALAVLALRYGSYRFPSDGADRAAVAGRAGEPGEG
jgi:phosphate starvation-inducible membrane PsiE